LKLAQSGERRMVFDTRGRRRHVIRVVYAILALLMGASLFLVVGPFSVADLFNNTSSTSGSAVLDDQAENIERGLRVKPDDEALLLALTRTRIGAGNALAETDPTTGRTVITPEGRAEFEQASQAWDRYLKQVDSPSPSGATLVARMFFSLAETTASVEEIVTTLKQAAKAQQIVAEAQPSASSLSTLAFYDYFAGDFAGGDKARRRALGYVPSLKEKEAIAAQLAGYRQRGKQFEKQKQEVARSQQGTGKEALENPLGGLAAGGGAQFAE